MSRQQRLYRNGIKVDTLYRAIRDSQAVELVPKLVKRVIQDEMWREHRYEKTGETFTFKSFRTFVETHPPDGLGTKVESLFRLCVEDPEAMDIIDQTLEKEAEETDGTAERKRPPISSARQAGLRRLRAYAEKNERVASLRQSVLAGEISLGAALVAAGLREKRVSIPRDVSKASEALRRIYTAGEFQQLVEMLTKRR
jgi:hypothetical protein